LGGGQGQQGGIAPIPGGGGGSYDGGQQGGNIPVIGGGDGAYAGGQQGGNLPISSGGAGSYVGGQQGGNIPASGTDPGLGAGYGDGELGGVGKPNTDGAGLLDLRIVNRVCIQFNHEICISPKHLSFYWFVNSSSTFHSLQGLVVFSV